MMLLLQLLLVLALAVPAFGHAGHDHGSAGDSFFGSRKLPYREWEARRGSRFSQRVFVPSAASPDDGVAVHWTIDEMSSSIHLAVATRATGWVGFGLAENGGMRGSDVVLFRADQPNQLTDAHVLDQLWPDQDACQNWQLDFSQTYGGFLIFEATRLLDTGDPQDRVFFNDTSTLVEPHLVIAAWGDSDTWAYHGLNHAKGAIRFFGDGTDPFEAFRQEMDQHAEGSFFLGGNNYTIPTNETTYQTFCFSAADLVSLGVPVNQSLHVIGVAPDIDARSRSYVHHFTSFSTETAAKDINGNCLPATGARGFLYGWAPGVFPITFGEDKGIPFGGQGGLQAAQIEIHYNNPQGDEGIPDNSGMRVYWTTQKRPIDVGGLPMADVRTALMGQPVSNGLSKHTFSCPASCTLQTLSGLAEPITVIGEYFHMHRTGARATNRVIRNGQVVHSASVEFFDFDQTGTQAVQQEPYQLLPGDSFETEFYYNTPPDGDTRFGFGSQEEMALLSMYYYPEQKTFGNFGISCSYDFFLPTCSASYNSTTLSSEVDLGRSFGSPLVTTLSSNNSNVCLAPSNKTVHYTPRQQPPPPPTSGALLPCWILAYVLIGSMTTTLFCM